MLSVVILRAKGLDAGIRYYNIGMGGAGTLEGCLSVDTFVQNTTGEHN